MEHVTIMDALNRRYATKQFDPTKKIDDKTLHILTESLRLAPSSNGLQLRWFVIVTDPAIRGKLSGAAHGQKQITDASHLIILCRKTHIDETVVIKHMKHVSEVRGIPPEDLAAHQIRVIQSIQGKTEEQRVQRATKQLYIPL